MKERRIIFVYNTDSGPLNALRDSAGRVFSASTYPCNLGALTLGAIGTRREWSHFVRKLDVKVESLHRDELWRKHQRAFLKEYPKQLAFPCMLEREGDFLRVLLSAEEIKAMGSLEELMDRITAVLLAKPPAKSSAAR